MASSPSATCMQRADGLRWLACGTRSLAWHQSCQFKGQRCRQRSAQTVTRAAAPSGGGSDSAERARGQPPDAQRSLPPQPGQQRRPAQAQAQQPEPAPAQQAWEQEEEEGAQLRAELLQALGGAEGDVPSVWQLKPWWCQPWSIVTTGSGAVAFVWAVSGHSPWWTGAAALPVAAWWGLFLVLYPAQFREYALEQRAEAARMAAAAAAQRRTAGGPGQGGGGERGAL